MSTLIAPGWIHENDQSGEPSDTPQDALLAWLRYGHGGCDHDEADCEVERLDGATHVVCLMELRTLKSDEEREAEMVGLDDDAHMAEIPIGGQYYHETKRRIYITEVQRTGDDISGALVISYKRMAKP